MTFLLAILKACAIVAVFVAATALHIEIENRRCRRCDACRLDRQPGRLFVALAHTCSKRRALWRSPDGKTWREFGREFGRIESIVAKRPAVTIGKRRTIPEFTRQARNVIPWKARQ